MSTAPLVRGAAILLPVGSAAVLATVRDAVAPSSAVLVLVLWVVAAAAAGDRAAGVLAALAAAASFDYFLTVPYLSLSISSGDDMETAGLLVVIGLVVNEVALWGRRQRGQAAQRAGYLEGLADVAASVAGSGASVSGLTGAVAAKIAEVLDADECHYVDGPVHDTRIALLDQQGRVLRNGVVWDADRSGLPVDEYLAVLVGHASDVRGHFLVTASTRVRRPTSEQRRVAALLADQLVATHPGRATGAHPTSRNR